MNASATTEEKTSTIFDDYRCICSYVARCKNALNPVMVVLWNDDHLPQWVGTVHVDNSPILFCKARHCGERVFSGGWGKVDSQYSQDSEYSVNQLRQAREIMDRHHSVLFSSHSNLLAMRVVTWEKQVCIEFTVPCKGYVPVQDTSPLPRVLDYVPCIVVQGWVSLCGKKEIKTQRPLIPGCAIAPNFLSVIAEDRECSFGTLGGYVQYQGRNFGISCGHNFTVTPTSDQFPSSRIEVFQPGSFANFCSLVLEANELEMMNSLRDRRIPGYSLVTMMARRILPDQSKFQTTDEMVAACNIKETPPIGFFLGGQVEEKEWWDSSKNKKITEKADVAVIALDDGIMIDSNRRRIVDSDLELLGPSHVLDIDMSNVFEDLFEINKLPPYELTLRGQGAISQHAKCVILAGDSGFLRVHSFTRKAEGALPVPVILADVKYGWQKGDSGTWFWSTMVDETKERNEKEKDTKIQFIGMGMASLCNDTTVGVGRHVCCVLPMKTVIQAAKDIIDTSSLQHTHCEVIMSV